MSTILEFVDVRILFAVLLLGLVLVHVVPFVLDPHALRTYPGPLLARFSDVWLAYVAAQGHRSEVVHTLHKKYGTFVRLAPDHLSIADPDALQVVYAHGNGTLKSNFYDAFVSIRRGVFNTRDRAEHARKRKIISHIFSQKSVTEFEPHIRLHVGTLIRQWDRLCDLASKSLSGTDGEGGWTGRNGQLWLDCLPWYNYLAFDIIGDLAFGSPFGMVQAARDSAAVATAARDAMNAYGKETVQKYVEIPAVKILNDRGEFSATMGVLPPWIRPFIRKLPWFRKGRLAVQNLAGMAIVMVAKRLSTPTDRTDLLSKLQEGKDDEGNPMGVEELTAEALTQLIAGSDTTSNSSCAITYYLAHYPKVQEKLQMELDEHLGTEDETVSTSEQVKRLPYLEAVINEALRLHSTSSLGLPRLVPAAGLIVSGRYFPEGTVLSVPSYTIHRDPKIWGDDVDNFRPERWFEQNQADIQKTFNPFSYGPRACVGRNLASMELLIIVSSILRRYRFSLQEDKPLETREGFLRKPVDCKAKLETGSKRDQSLYPLLIFLRLRALESPPPSGRRRVMVWYRRAPNFGPNAETSFSTVGYADPTSTPTSVNSNSSSPSLTASPPLILAFLAIGLFTVAMIALFGCKRVSPRRRWVAERMDVASPPPEAGERPRLWDLWTVPAAVGADSRWEDIMPFSAQTTLEKTAEGNLNRGRLGAQGGLTGTLLRGFEHFRLPILTRHSASITTSERLKARLQVAVPIAMPCPSRRQDSDSNAVTEEATEDREKKEKDLGASADERFVYSIGLFEVPWRKPASVSDGW